MKTKVNGRTRVMRGQTHRQEWAIVYFDHIIKRWRDYECGSAATMIVQFVMDKYVRTGVTRLLAPGGIIAGEHNAKRRRDKPTSQPVEFLLTVTKRGLVSTAKFMHSINTPKQEYVDIRRVVTRERVTPTKPTGVKPGQFKPIERTGQSHGSGLVNNLVGLPGYPFLTLRDPRARKPMRK